MLERQLDSEERALLGLNVRKRLYSHSFFSVAWDANGTRRQALDTDHTGQKANGADSAMPPSGKLHQPLLSSNNNAEKKYPPALSAHPLKRSKTTASAFVWACH